MLKKILRVSAITTFISYSLFLPAEQDETSIDINLTAEVAPLVRIYNLQKNELAANGTIEIKLQPNSNLKMAGEVGYIYLVGNVPRNFVTLGFTQPTGNRLTSTTNNQNTMGINMKVIDANGREALVPGFIRQTVLRSTDDITGGSQARYNITFESTDVISAYPVGTYEGTYLLTLSPLVI